MLPNDSQEMPSEGNDNQFLPNNSHSYESMIKEHQERRSLMLNDQLLMPSALSDPGKERQEQNLFEPSMRGMLGGESEMERGGFGQDQMKQDEENQFMVNQQSLVASIKQAIQSKQSKMQNSNSHIQHFPEEQHSNNEHLFPSYNSQRQQSNFQPSEKEEYQENDENVPHLGNDSGDFGRMDNNFQSKNQDRSQAPQSEIRRNSIESDFFHIVASQQQNQNELLQNFPQKSTLKKDQRNIINFQQSQEPQNQFLEKDQSQNFLGNHYLSKQPKQDQIQQQLHKSRSQIQGIYSDLDAESGIKQLQQQPYNSNNSQDIPSHNTQSQALQNQQVQSNQQLPQSNHSLSNLMNYNYFQKDNHHQFSQKVQSQELPSSNNIQQSEVKVFKQQYNAQLGDIDHQSKNSKIELKDASIGQIEPIMMNYESNISINQKNMEPKQQSIINNINNFSQNVNKSHVNMLQINPQPSLHTNFNHFSEQSKNQRIDLEQIDRIKIQHSEQVQQFDINHSQIRSSQKQSSSKRASQHSQHYFNEFNDQEQQIDYNNHQEISINNKSLHEQSEKEYQVYDNNQQIVMQSQLHSQIRSKQSSIKHEKQLSMHSIKNHSKIEQYDLHSYSGHKKQQSVLQRSLKNNSGYYLPEIDTKNKRSSQISRKSIASKKKPSIKIENDSQLSTPSSKHQISKKNSSKFLKNTRQKMVSYSQGMQIDNQNSQIYRQVQLGSTTLDSKSNTMKKKEETAKQIFNTVPEGIQIINSEPFVQIQQKYKQKLIIVKNKPSTNIENSAQPKEIVLKSPTKQREEQIQRIRLLKQAQRKRLQRQLEKVKKELSQINTRQKDMDRIFEEKQKMQAKERERAIINSRQNDFPNKVTRHHRENEALLNIIKQHRKSKETNEQTNDNFEQNIAKNLLQLNQIRKQAEQKMKQKKRLEILDRMKKNQMRKLNEQKLIKANNQYIQQFRSVDNPVLSPQPYVQNQSKEKGLGSYKKIQKEAGVGSRASKFVLYNQRKMGTNIYEQKLD